LPQPFRPHVILLLPALAGLCLAGCIDAEAIKAPDKVDVQTPAESREARLERLAKSDPIALLNRCLDHYQQTYQNYVCTFTKQERIDGVLRQPQTIRIWFRDEPFSVAMKWLKNPGAGDRLLYVAGKFDGKMLVRPAVGWQRALVGSRVQKDPDDPEVRKHSLRPVTMFGFARNLKDLIHISRQARQKSELKMRFDGYAEVDGRRCLVLVRKLPDAEAYPAVKTTLYIDMEYLVPTAIRAENAEGKLASSYFYRQLQFNLPLEDEVFTPESLGM
jgi:hypothetical protein